MKIGIDIDDTLVDTRSMLKKYWKEYYLNNPNKEYNEKIPNNINTGWEEKYINKFWDLYRFKLAYPPFKENAKEILHKLKKENYSLCIITSRQKEKYPNLENNLKEWFQKNDIPVDYIHTDVLEKGLFCKNNQIDILIDDTITHINNANQHKIKTILFNNNKEYKGIQTDNWKDLYNIIKEL